LLTDIRKCGRLGGQKAVDGDLVNTECQQYRHACRSTKKCAEIFVIIRRQTNKNSNAWHTPIHVDPAGRLKMRESKIQECKMRE